MENKSYWIGAVAAMIGAIAGPLIYNGVITPSKRMPEISEVQSGYIAPSRLEIECRDLDGNGESETIMKIGDQAYLLREIDGKPVISAYEVRPAKIVPKSE